MTSIQPPTTMHVRRSAFTLVELMVAAAVIALLMLLLFRFVITAQRAWQLSESSSRIYENSRVAYDVIERDVRALMTSSISGQEIGCYVGDPDPSDASNCLHACFVAATEPQDGAKSRLCEIAYKHHTDASAPATQYVLRRQLVSDTMGANWDFLGQPASWYVNNALVAGSAPAFETVVEGVSEFEMLFYDSDDNLIAAGSDSAVTPNRIVVNLVLFDQTFKDMPDSVKFRSQRAFTKIFYLGLLQ